MAYEITTHYDMLALALAITAGQCTNPACAASHWRLSLTFVFWSIECWF